jgi:hypothetical protein
MLPNQRVERAAHHLVEDLAGIDVQVGDEPGDVLGALAAVEAVPLQHDPLAGDVLGDVVGRGARKRRLGPLRVCGKIGWHRAKERHSVQEIGDALRQSQGQDPSLRESARKRGRLAGEHLARAEDLQEGT